MHELHHLRAVERQPNERAYDVSDREAVKNLNVRRLSERGKEQVSDFNLMYRGQGILTDAEANAGYTVGDGTVPGQLGLVDSHMWTVGPFEPLRVENVHGLRCRLRLRLNTPIACRTKSEMPFQNIKSLAKASPPYQDIAESSLVARYRCIARSAPSPLST